MLIHAVLGPLDVRMSIGGESTAMGIIAGDDDFFKCLREWIDSDGGRPVWGTCAGMIILVSAAKKLTSCLLREKLIPTLTETLYRILYSFVSADGCNQRECLCALSSGCATTNTMVVYTIALFPHRPHLSLLHFLCELCMMLCG